MDQQQGSGGAPAVHPISGLLNGQKAIVTGANSGIGKAIAIALGQAGRMS